MPARHRDRTGHAEACPSLSLASTGLPASFPCLGLDEGTQATMAQLATNGRRLGVRGWARIAPGGPPAFDEPRCLFLYRLAD